MTQTNGETQNQSQLTRILWFVVAVLLGVGTVTGGLGAQAFFQASQIADQTELALKILQDPERKNVIAEEAEQTRKLQAQQDALGRLQVQQGAYAETRRHLRLDSTAKMLILAEEQSVLREMPVEIGDAVHSPLLANTLIGRWLPPSDAQWPAPGVHRLWGRVGRGIFLQKHTVELLEAPWADGNPIPVNLSGALVLEDGTALYSEYADPVLPPVRSGAIRVAHKDLTAVLSLLEETPVYVW